MRLPRLPIIEVAFVGLDMVLYIIGLGLGDEKDITVKYVLDRGSLGRCERGAGWVRLMHVCLLVTCTWLDIVD